MKISTNVSKTTIVLTAVICLAMLAGCTSTKLSEDFAVVVVKAKYEIRTFTYTISFTKQLKLAGLYYK